MTKIPHVPVRLNTTMRSPRKTAIGQKHLDMLVGFLLLRAILMFIKSWNELSTDYTLHAAVRLFISMKRKFYFLRWDNDALHYNVFRSVDIRCVGFRPPNNHSVFVRPSVKYVSNSLRVQGTAEKWIPYYFLCIHAARPPPLQPVEVRVWLWDYHWGDRACSPTVRCVSVACCRWFESEFLMRVLDKKCSVDVIGLHCSTEIPSSSIMG